MSGYFLALGLSFAVVLFLIYLMRKRRLREKYAVIWLALAIIVSLVGAFPQMVFWLTRLVGVEVPSNLVFAVAIVVLLIVCIQLSTELTEIEEETRTLAEEVALLRLDFQQTQQLQKTQQLQNAQQSQTGQPAIIAQPALPHLGLPDGAAESSPQLEVVNPR